MICAGLLEVGAGYGLEAGDVQSRSMGANGTDVILSPAAERLFGSLAIEAKNHETLNVVSVFHQHAQKYPKATPLLIHKKNRTEPLVTLRMRDYLALLDRSISSENQVTT